MHDCKRALSHIYIVFCYTFSSCEHNIHMCCVALYCLYYLCVILYRNSFGIGLLSLTTTNDDGGATDGSPGLLLRKTKTCTKCTFAKFLGRGGDFFGVVVVGGKVFFEFPCVLWLTMSPHTQTYCTYRDLKFKTQRGFVCHRCHIT